MLAGFAMRKHDRPVIVAIHDRVSRESACEFLKEAGLLVLPAPSCQVALNACRSALTDPVLVAEIRLPDMWGLDLARAATLFHFKTLVICISEKELRQQCQEEINERGWLCLKTFSPQAILQAMQDSSAVANSSRQQPSHAITGTPATRPQTRNCG
jgi:DNA-binding NtrC family response regulator